MADGVRQSYTFRDAKGNTATMRMYLDSTDTAANVRTNGLHIENDLAALTNAVVTGNGPYTDVAVAPAYGAAANYQTVEDKAVFTFADSGGALHRYQVPAPKTSLFYADQETVDNTVTVVKQFIADMLDATYSGQAPTVGTTKATVNRAGQALVSYIGGFRARKPMKRKVNIYTLNPAETGPAE